MPLLLVVLFIIVPLVELWAIGQVSGFIGLGWTLVLLLVDSIIGAVLVRREGSRAWRKFREAMAAGRVPGDELLNGVLLLFGGALLLTPGFVTDIVGLALVLPITRMPLAKLIRVRFVPVPLQAGTSFWNGMRSRPGDDPSPPGGGQIGDTPDAEPSIEVLSVERDDGQRARGDEGLRARGDDDLRARGDDDPGA